MNKSAADILAERQRQIHSEAWTPEHDDHHTGNELAIAAACYAAAGDAGFPINPPHSWPWHKASWKPSNHRANLVKAGALILAEIDRLDRKEVAHDVEIAVKAVELARSQKYIGCVDGWGQISDNLDTLIADIKAGRVKL